MHKKTFVLLFCMIFFLSLVSAVKPLSSVETTQGFIVESVDQTYVRTGEDYEFEVHVFNATTGLHINEGISCYFHMYNKSGNHIVELEDSTSGHNFDYSFNVAGGNWTRGNFVVKIQCNATNYGGGEELFVRVNDYGEELTDPLGSNFHQGMWMLMILFSISLFGVFKVENPSGKLACYWVAHLFFVIGTFSVWQYNMGYTIAYSGLAGIFKVLFYVSITAVFPMILLSIAWMFYIHTMNDTIKGFMDRGMDEDEAYSRAKSNRRNRK